MDLLVKTHSPDARPTEGTEHKIRMCRPATIGTGGVSLMTLVLLLSMLLRRLLRPSLFLLLPARGTPSIRMCTGEADGGFLS